MSSPSLTDFCDILANFVPDNKLCNDDAQLDFLWDVNFAIETIVSRSVIKESGKSIFLALYGSKNQNDFQFVMFKKLSARQSFQLHSLPATESAATQHHYRVYYQVQNWLGNHKNPLAWGWTLGKNGVKPVKVVGSLISNQSSESVPCKCKTDCKSAKCTCRKHGLNCSEICTNCFPNCTNVKDITFNEDYDEDDVVDDDVMDSEKCEETDSDKKGVLAKIAKIELDFFLKRYSNVSECKC